MYALDRKQLLSARRTRVLRSTAGWISLGCQAEWGQDPMPQKEAKVSPRDLAQVSLENLMNVEVTSVSKKEQKLSQVAAAIFVIAQEDIRQSGASNILDLRRMVPGLNVAQINANTWAISARGFNLQFNNKLLVLIASRACTNAQLRISSRLLALAKSVIGGQRGT
jgi:outer membrane receptor protein involved in Fe transport